MITNYFKYHQLPKAVHKFLNYKNEKRHKGK